VSSNKRDNVGRLLRTECPRCEEDARFTGELASGSLATPAGDEPKRYGVFRCAGCGEEIHAWKRGLEEAVATYGARLKQDPMELVAVAWRELGRDAAHANDLAAEAHLLSSTAAEVASSLLAWAATDAMAGEFDVALSRLVQAAPMLRVEGSEAEVSAYSALQACCANRQGAADVLAAVAGMHMPTARAPAAEYPTCDQTHATLRVIHRDLDPDEVDAMLGAAATRRFRRDAMGHTRHGGWLLSSKGRVHSRDIRDHLDWILHQVSDRGEAFATLRARGCQVDVFCYWASASGHGGPTLSPPQMATLASLGLEIGFDIYFNA